ncbi:MAG: ABC transporter ATP-binding protein [Clostridiales bacterium]|nr:ABC transporter ATP-binding protein [Clostridiales bacterium]
MLHVQNVKKTYQNFTLNCSFSIQPGYITGLVGENGAGKSTTFKAILGLISIDAGKIELFGKDIHDFTNKDREQLGVVLSDSGFSGYLMIKDIVPILQSMYHSFDKQAFLQGCSKYRLPLDKQIRNFSTGMKAKLKILVAVSHNAKFLLLDEPTAGLDVTAREDLLDMLRTYMEQDETRTVLISSHISSDLENLCDDIYLIHDGEIILHEDTDLLLSNYGIIKTDQAKFDTLEKQYLLRKKKESYGYACLTNEKQYYIENAPDVIVESSGIDEMITMMIRGERV